MRNLIAVAVAGAALPMLSVAALAQARATATTDLNLRAGPGPQHQVVGVVKADDAVTVSGCLEGSKWCRVRYEGREAWAYSDYLSAEVAGSAGAGSRVVLTERRSAVPVVQYDPGSGAAGSTAGLTTGAVGGAIAGALIGGPVGAAIGGVAGATAGGATGGIVGAAIDPPRPVRQYISSNATDPVYLEGEVVVGAGVPEAVTLHTIPDYEYRYAYINGVPVLVEPRQRRIVYVVR